MAPWSDVDPSLFMGRYEEAQTRRTEGFNRWKPQQGPIGKPHRNVFRILPPHPSMGPDPIFPMGKLHFSLGPKFDTAAPCLEPYGEACPACEWVAATGQRGRAAATPQLAQQYKDLAYKQQAQFQFGCQVVDMAHPESGVQPYYLGPADEKRLRACFLDRSNPPQFRNISHPETGRNVIMDVSTKPGTTYRQYDLVVPDEVATPLHDMGWLDLIADLSQEVLKPTREQVENVLRNGVKIDRRGGTQALAAPGVASAAPPAISAPAPSAPARPAPPAAAAAPPAAVVPAAAAPPAPRRPAAAPPAAAVAPPPAQAAPSAPPAARPLPATPTAAVASPAPSPVASKRQPMGAPVPASTNGASPYDRSKQEVTNAGRSVDVEWTPKDITPERLRDALAKGEAPPCLAVETDPTDKACRDCGCLIPCWAAKNGYQSIDEFLLTTAA